MYKEPTHEHKKTTFASRLKRGDLLMGSMITSISPKWSRTLENNILDFVFIDTEHTPIDRIQASWMCQVFFRMGIYPFVRIPSPSPYEATALLDGGAQGLIAPYIETVDEVRKLVAAVKYRPLKGEKVEHIVAGTEIMGDQLSKYIHERNAENTLVVNIESIPAMRNLDDILQVAGLDGVLIGPHDLSTSLGIPEQYEHPMFKDACFTIFRKARARGLGAGIHHFWGSGTETIPEFLSHGCNFLIHKADMALFQLKLNEDLQGLKTMLKSKL